MKKSLIHLPQYKRDELKRIVKIIRRQFPSAHMIVLFGSYARGQWVEHTYTEGHITYEYISDFDILVLTRLKKTANNHSKQSTVDNLIIQHKAIKTPVSVIYHSVGQVNYRLKEGRYFFSDIKKEGLLLYDSAKFKLARRKKLDPQQRAELAKTDFKQWSKNAKGAYRQFEHATNDRDYKWAAFMLHQATEAFYAAIMLVFINYKPKSHDLRKLSRMAANYDHIFFAVFPQATVVQKDCFDLLKPRLRRSPVRPRLQNH